MKTFALTSLSLLALSLVACGGGGSSTPTNSQPIKDALEDISAHQPTLPSFTGAFMEVNGVAIGFVSGKSEREAVASAVKPIVDNPTLPANVEAYRLLLSDQGLKVKLFGEQVAVGGASGLPIYAPDVVAVVTLRNDGLHVVF